MNYVREHKDTSEYKSFDFMDRYTQFSEVIQDTTYDYTYLRETRIFVILIRYINWKR